MELAAGREGEDVQVVVLDLVAAEPQVRRDRGGHGHGRIDRVLGRLAERSVERLRVQVVAPW